MTDASPIITNEDAAIDTAFFGSHAGPNLLRARPPHRMGSGRAPNRRSARVAGDAAGVGPA